MQHVQQHPEQQKGLGVVLVFSQIASTDLNTSPRSNSLLAPGCAAEPRNKSTSSTSLQEQRALCICASYQLLSETA